MEGASQPSRRRRTAIRVLAFLLIVAALWGMGRSVDLVGLVGSIRLWAHELGPWAPSVFVVGYVVATSVGVPGTPLTISAAILFGPLDGLLLMILASTGTAVAGFWIARTMARAPLERWLSQRRTYERMQAIVKDHQWTAVPFLRVLPLFPFALVNYGLGLSRISFWQYLLASELAMIPMNAAWIWSAESVYRIVLRGETPWGLLAVTSALGIALVVLAHVGRRVLSIVNGAGGEPGREEAG